MNPTIKSERFLAMVESHKGIIYKVANSYCLDLEERKDLVQEIIVQLWRSFDHFDPRFKFSTWIYKIALNVAISFYRKESRKNARWGPLSESIFQIADPQEDLRDLEDKNEDLALLQKFVLELKELDRALMLLYLDEKSYREIAEIIGISETNVATKISRIKLVLKQKFEQINQKKYSHGR